MRKLLETIRRENTAFTNNLDVFLLLKSYHVRIGMTNDRMKSQKGSFLISGLDKFYINDQMKSNRVMRRNDEERNKTQEKPTFLGRRIIIDKEKIRKQLYTLSINETTLFPHVDKRAEFLQKRD